MIDMFSLTSGIPRYYNQLFSRTDKLLAHSKKFHSRIQAEENNSKKNYKAVPSNASVREEHIRCGRPTCAYCPHGPYYYAYWKDVNGKVKKKYIGIKFEPSWRQRRMPNRKSVPSSERTKGYPNETQH